MFPASFLAYDAFLIRGVSPIYFAEVAVLRIKIFNFI